MAKSWSNSSSDLVRTVTSREGDEGLNLVGMTTPEDVDLSVKVHVQLGVRLE